MSNEKPSGGWTIAEGVTFIARHQNEAFSRRYNLALGGSVLMKCLSWHDLDIICTPGCWRDNADTATKHYSDEFLAWVRGMYPNGRCLQEWNSRMVKYACTLPDGRWIDWFIVIGEP